MQILHWVDPADPVVQTWNPHGVVVVRDIHELRTGYFTTMVQFIHATINENCCIEGEAHVALLDDGVRYTDTEYYQRQDQEGLDIPSSYRLGAPARHEKRVPKKVKANPAGGATRGQTKSGRRKSKAGLDH